MRDREIVGLWEAYLQVHQPKEEVEQLDESGLSQRTIRSAVRKRQERVDADYREDTPEGDERGDKGMKKLARSKRQLKINEPREVRMRANEEVEQLDEFLGSGVQKFVDKSTKGVQSGLEKLGFPINRTPKGTTTQKQQQEKIKPIKPVGEEVENWVNSLIDEGYDLSEYTWEDMYEMYVNLDEEYDTFDAILEHLVAEGYADTNESALVIMANMSEEWRESIVLDERNRGERGMSDREVTRRRNLGGNVRFTVSSSSLGDHGPQSAIQKFHKRKSGLRKAIHKSGRNTRGDTGESGGKGRYEANKDHIDGYPSITKRGEGPG